ncbi:bacterial proteasome activator family protein [Enemella sp. A6]|uniref:bacterial proteasome activator family protein n=1 Tax=Enemella sp. A6 TaxID=3440152 RepID=UPI003EB9312D
MSESDAEQPRTALTGSTDDGRTYVISPTSMAVEENGDTEEEQTSSPTDMVSEPAKVMRIGTMVRQLLEEVRSAPLDDPGRRRLAQLQAASIDELKDGLSPELAEELERLTTPFNSDEAPTDAELRISQAQLVGWLEGLFQGIQTALVAQQMAARAQLDQMRRALPGTPGGMPGAEPDPTAGPGGGHSGGMYL